MQVTISGRHIDLTAANREYAQRKAGRLLRYFDRIQQIDILIDRVKNGYRVEIIVEVERHEPFVATMRHADLYACIDLAIDRASRQLTDHKSKVRDHKHSIQGTRFHEGA